jgi:hypothetical protein
LGYHFLTSQTFQEALIVPVSFPDVVGTLTPTVRTTLVHAIPAFRIAEISRLTHKAFSIITDAKLDFCLSILRHRLFAKKVFTNKLTALSDGYVYMENNS